MATLAQLRTRILSKIEDGNIVSPTAAQVDAQINSTIDFYEQHKFWFLEDTANLTASTGVSALTGIPNDYNASLPPNTLTLVKGGIKYPLRQVTPLQFNTLDASQNGQPYWFTYSDSQFKVLPLPDQSYTIELFYTKTLPDLVADGDSNVMTVNAARLVEYHTLMDVLRDYRSDFERAAIYEARVAKELAQISRQTYERTATGMLTVESINDYDSDLALGRV